MFSIKNLYDAIDAFAPFYLSDNEVKSGGYDNSGIILESQSEVNGVLFSLDLTEKAVKTAKKYGVNTIVTHHPAIYKPVKSLSANDGTTAAILLAANFRLNVLSAHLNLDAAERGIDFWLAKGLGAKEFSILYRDGDKCGYGREFTVNATLNDLKKRVKENFSTDKIIIYGEKGKTIKNCACFCGGGSEYALNAVKSGKTDAELIVTSDMPHHVIKELTEYGKSIIILPHYVAEEYGFNKFYQELSSCLKNVKTYYFYDKRFI